MTRYLLLRTRVFAEYIGLVSLVLVVIDYIHPSEALEPVKIMLCMSPMASLKSKWYLLAPYSRKKLLFFHAVESVMLFLIVTIALTILYTLHLQFYVENSESGLLTFTIIGTAVMSLARCTMPVSNLTGQNNALIFAQSSHSKKNFFLSRQFRAFWGFGLVLILSQTGQLRQPLVLLVCGCAGSHIPTIVHFPAL
jgi:hypothetical protein